MAIGNPTVRHTANDKQSTGAGLTTWDSTLETQIDAGEYAIALYASDNLGGPGGLDGPEARTILTDSKGNPWQRVHEYDDEAAAESGEHCAVYVCKVKHTLTTSDTIRWQTNNNTRTFAAQGCVIMAGTPTSGKRLFWSITKTAQAGGAADPASMTLTPSEGSKEYLFIRAFAGCNADTVAFTKTAAYGGEVGVASSGSGTTGGVNTTNIKAWMEWEIKTGTASDASDPATATDVVHVDMMLAFYEVDDWAGPYYIGAGLRGNASTNTPYSLPLGWAADDILVIVAESNGGEQPATPTGWSVMADSPQDCSDSRLSVFWKRAVGGETDPAVAADSVRQSGICFGIRGCPTSGNPYDVTSGGTDTTTNPATIAGDTTTVANCLVAVFLTTGQDSNNTHVVPTNTTAGWTSSELANLFFATGAGTSSGGGGSYAVGLGELAAAGTYGTTSVDLDVTPNSAQMTVAFKPLVAAGGFVSVIIT